MSLRGLIGLVGLVGLVGSIKAGSAEPSSLVVGPNVLVSATNGAVPHMEVVACADRARQSLLVASMAALRGRWITYVYWSGDAGKTWREVLKTTEPGSFGDPTCDFGADGRAYYGVLWGRFQFPAVRGVRSLESWVYSSPDGGRTWPSIPAKQMGIDRPFLATDQSKRWGSDYVYYTALWVSDSLTGHDPGKLGADDPNVESGVALFASTDNGRTFSLAGSPRHGRSDWVYGVGNSVVTASGELVTLFRVLKNRFSRPYVERTDDASTLSVLRTNPGGEPTEPADAIGVVRGSGSPALAVDRTPRGSFRDRLYGVLIDEGSVVLFWSADEGRTWHGPTKVRAAATSSDASVSTVFNTSVAVNRDGVVGVGWAEGSHARDAVYKRSWTYRMSASWDGGQTFSQPVTVSSDRHDASRPAVVPLLGRIAREESDRQIGFVTVDPFADSGGHTFGLTADAKGVFHAAWTDNRTGVSQLWTAAVRTVSQNNEPRR